MTDSQMNFQDKAPKIPPRILSTASGLPWAPEFFGAPCTSRTAKPT